MPLGDLTGVWATEDGSHYYIRQIQDEIWWVGMSAPWRFHPGVDWTNVFHGHLDRTTNSIEGAWADVPRGGILQNGTLTIDIVQVSALAVSPSAARRPPNGNGGNGGGNGQRQTTELHKRPGTGGPFGASIWHQVDAFPPSDIGFRFDTTRRNDGDTMHAHLKLYKDYVVVFGQITDDFSVGDYPADPAFREYCEFIAHPWWTGHGDPPDGDIDCSIQIIRADLDAQPNFWSEGWLQPDPNQIRNKLNDNTDNEMNRMGCELIMYGWDKDADHCHETGTAVVLLPGYQDSNGNSVLINGRPIEGDIVNSIFSRPNRSNAQVRVTGVLVLDCHGTDCGEFNPTDHNVEIHPVYSIDFRQDFNQPRSGANLTGVWHSNDVGTYYIRQIDNTIWWLGLSRDQGQRFANVFQGTIAGDTIMASGSSQIIGQWADVPVALNGARNSGSLGLNGDGRGALSTALTGGGANFGGNRWTKLYDSV